MYFRARHKKDDKGRCHCQHDQYGLGDGHSIRRCFHAKQVFSSSLNFNKRKREKPQRDECKEKEKKNLHEHEYFRSKKSFFSSFFGIVKENMTFLPNQKRFIIDKNRLSNKFSRPYFFPVFFGENEFILEGIKIGDNISW